MQPNNPYYPPGPAVPQGTSSGQMPQPMQPMQTVPSMPQGPTPKRGSMPAWAVISLIMLVILLLGAGGFAAWAFSERQDYKNNSDAKVAAAVEVAKKETTEENAKQFAEEQKNPLKTYVGPGQYGSVSVKYPKTWSAYIDTRGESDAPLTALFHPDIVPATSTDSDTNAVPIALTIRVFNESYDSVLEERASYVTEGAVKASAYALPKMPEEVGVKLVGKLNEQLNGTEIIIPLRDKTLVITTETDQFKADFEKYILPNLTFVP